LLKKKPIERNDLRHCHPPKGHFLKHCGFLVRCDDPVRLQKQNRKNVRLDVQTDWRGGDRPQPGRAVTARASFVWTLSMRYPVLG